MYKNKQIAAVVTAYNEEKMVGRVITTMPDIVDVIIVVDDASMDRTSEVVESYRGSMGDRLVLIRHVKNQGSGGSVLTGHRRALEMGMDVCVAMAGDAQMDPEDMPRVLDPVVENRADYVKGNRFYNGEAWKKMPKVRYFGNAGLSLLNKFASGYWRIGDPQCGYTSISRQTLETLDFEKICKRYHFENSMLMHLNILGARVMDVPVKAIYGVGEESGINHVWALFSFSWFMVSNFFWRIWEKYFSHRVYHL